MGLGRPGVLALAEGWLTVSREACFSRVGLACLVSGVGNTPAVVGCCGLVVVVVCWWWVPSRVLGACGGGMLSGFWGSAPWLPDPCSAALFVGGGVWVWVGWL